MYVHTHTLTVLAASFSGGVSCSLLETENETSGSDESLSKMKSSLRVARSLVRTSLVMTWLGLLIFTWLWLYRRLLIFIVGSDISGDTFSSDICSVRCSSEQGRWVEYPGKGNH